MKMRIALLAMAVGLSACGGPYQGKPDKVPRVRRSEPPPVAVDDRSTERPIVWDVNCSARFVGSTPSKDAGKSAPLVKAGDDAVDAAARNDQAPDQIALLIDAIESYKKALLANHYDPAATFGLAVAYAQVRKKGCALVMLKRLAVLGDNPRLAGGRVTLDQWLDRVEDEAAFALFKNEAMGAIGR